MLSGESVRRLFLFIDRSVDNVENRRYIMPHVFYRKYISTLCKQNVFAKNVCAAYI